MDCSIGGFIDIDLNYEKKLELVSPNYAFSLKRAWNCVQRIWFETAFACNQKWIAANETCVSRINRIHIYYSSFNIVPTLKLHRLDGVCTFMHTAPILMNSQHINKFIAVFLCWMWWCENNIQLLRQERWTKNCSAKEVNVAACWIKNHLSDSKPCCACYAKKHEVKRIAPKKANM